MHDRGFVRMPFGKHKGHPLADVPTSYLAWLLDECGNLDRWLREAVRGELADRLDLHPARPSPPPCGRCAAVADRRPLLYSRLARAVHPDHGGSKEAMQIANEADELVGGVAP